MKAALITSKGLGDGLIMTIVAQHLVKLGYSVDIFNPHLEELKTWFPEYGFKKKPEKLADFENYADYDWVLCQHSNTPFAEELKKNRKKLKKCSLIYVSFNPERHQPLDLNDFICDRNLPLADSLQIMGKKFFKLENPTKDTGVKIPSHLTFQKYKKRILIHPTSTCLIRTWDKKKYMNFARHLRDQGYEISFVMHPTERIDWEGIVPRGFTLPVLNDLTALASYVYESAALIGNDSGPVHLASLLNLPTLIITNDPKRLTIWQTGWRKSLIVFPPNWVPNFKFLRLKMNSWQRFTSARRILKAFTKLNLTGNARV